MREKELEGRKGGGRPQMEGEVERDGVNLKERENRVK